MPTIAHTYEDLLQKPIPKRFFSRGMGQAYYIRELAFRLAVRAENDPLNQELRERLKIVSQAQKTWEAADERVRIHRNKPLPGTRSTKPEKQPKAERSIPAGVKAGNGQVKAEVQSAPGVTEADTPAEPLCVPKSSSKVRKATSEGKGP